MRSVFYLMLLGSLAMGQEQQPRYQPGWPCTGKERAFDPSYSKIAEATGGHLFLNDKSETMAMAKLAIGGMGHNATISRATGKLESYLDVRIPVDSSVQSLFFVISIQCMQTVQIYDPNGQGARPEDTPGGEDNWYRAGRISTIPKPVPGVWTVRLSGSGYYSYAVEAKTPISFQASFDAASKKYWTSPPGNIAQPAFSAVGGDGALLGKISPDGEISYASFRIQMNATDSGGFPIQRMDPRLFGK